MAWESVKVSPIDSPARVYALWFLICWNEPKNDQHNPHWLNIVCKLCENVWRSVWQCVKVLSINLPAGVHTFWYPTCLCKPNKARGHTRWPSRKIQVKLLTSLGIGEMKATHSKMDWSSNSQINLNW